MLSDSHVNWNICVPIPPQHKCQNIPGDAEFIAGTVQDQTSQPPLVLDTEQKKTSCSHYRCPSSNYPQRRCDKGLLGSYMARLDPYVRIAMIDDKRSVDHVNSQSSNSIRPKEIIKEYSTCDIARLLPHSSCLWRGPFLIIIAKLELQTNTFAAHMYAWLTHLPLGKTTVISQTALSSVSSWMKMLYFDWDFTDVCS